MHPSLVSGRVALLHAHRALGAHAGALILVGAHAVQEWAGDTDADIGGSPESKDADVQVDAAALGPDPTLEAAMESAGFVLANQPGIWISREGVQVDLLVAEAQARGRGERSAGLDPRDPKSARRVKGLEGCLVLNEDRRIATLGEGERTEVLMRVARPAALVVAKCFKLAERLAQRAERARGKDALDVLRLLRLEEPAISPADFRTLASHARFGTVAVEGVEHLRALFSRSSSPGCVLLRREYPDLGATLAAQMQVLAADLLAQVAIS